MISRIVLEGKEVAVIVQLVDILPGLLREGGVAK